MENMADTEHEVPTTQDLYVENDGGKIVVNTDSVPTEFQELIGKLGEARAFVRSLGNFAETAESKASYLNCVFAKQQGVLEDYYLFIKSHLGDEGNTLNRLWEDSYQKAKFLTDDEGIRFKDPLTNLTCENWN